MDRPGLGAVIMAALVFAASVSARAGDGMLQTVSATELRANTHGHFIARAEINGRDIVVMIDTGATAVALSYEDAEEAGLRPGGLDFDIPISTANGIGMAARVRLDRVEIDGVRVHDVEGVVLPEGMLRGSLLGMSYLSRLRSFKIEDGVLRLED
jgi:aspartyl protease family protein